MEGVLFGGEEGALQLNGGGRFAQHCERSQCPCVCTSKWLHDVTCASPVEKGTLWILATHSCSPSHEAKGAGDLTGQQGIVGE